MPLIILPNNSSDAATNMAIDAVSLGFVPEGSALFRHYSWTEPAITFGYTQRIKEIKTAIPKDAKLCRRITGGGIVNHSNDWTYALTLHAQLTAANIQATELYAIMHRCIQQALADQSVTTRLAPCPRACGKNLEPQPSPSQCFTLPAANDVIDASGRKIAGAAMKRTRQGLLIQGSIDRSTLPEPFNYKNFARSLQKMLSSALNLDISEEFENLPDEQLVQQERKRFESIDWTNKR